MVTLFRISIKTKETDKRKNATVFRYVVAALSLDEAKVLAVAKWMDRELDENDLKAKFPRIRTHTLDKIAEVYGHGMDTLVYNCDIQGDKDHSEQPDTVPALSHVRAARARLDAMDTE